LQSLAVLFNDGAVLLSIELAPFLEDEYERLRTLTDGQAVSTATGSA